jgi:hypothetical protein
VPCAHPINAGIAQPFSEEQLIDRQVRLRLVANDRTTRITVYDISGTQIGLSGVGEHEQRLTFPACYMVGQALEASNWIRFASIEEQAQILTWWTFAQTRPACIVYANGVVAPHDMPIGFDAEYVTALAQEPQIFYEDIPSGSLDDVHTPRSLHDTSDSESEDIV